jgi:carbonic anhydrase
VRTALAGTAAGLMTAAGLDLATLRSALAQSALSPEAALQELMAGNVRYISGGLTSFAEDLAELKQKTAEKQEPFAAVLACADSRVPVELIFDHSIVRLFVTRVAGNIATLEIIASLEYGAAVLGTKAVMVLGHGNCGAVKAAIAAKPVPGQISALYAPLRPAVDQAGGKLDEAIRANAKMQATVLREASPVLAGLVKEKKLTVVGAYYDLASGKVTVLG